MESVFIEITQIVCVAAVFAIFARLLKQPPVLAYLFAGIFMGSIGIFKIENLNVLETLGEFGVTFLLFTLGLELKIFELKSVGKTAFIAGVGQVIGTSIVGYIIAKIIGFSNVESLYIGIALTFSSTIIAVKLLSDKKDLNSLYGKISVGILLVQDFVAIMLLVFLSGFNSGVGSVPVASFIILIIKAIGLFAVVFYLSLRILPKIVHTISSSSEVLFLFSIAWAFGVAALVSSPLFGFSIEIGGFLAGLSLAHSTEHFQIAAKVKPLRDFFITIFFVILGIQMSFGGIGKMIVPGLVFSFFVLGGKPLIVTAILGLMGFRKRTSFLTGVTIAQISEFSLILIFLAHKLGHISSDIVSFMTIVAVISFTGSTYMILNSNKLYRKFYSYLDIFQKKHTILEEKDSLSEMKDHIVLVGAHRTGQSIVETLKELKDRKVVVLDFDPDVVELLRKKGVLTVFGDIADPEIQEMIQLDRAHLVISTVPDVEDNLFLIETLNHQNKRAKVIVLASDQEDAKRLYRAGADYVVVPHLGTGRHIAKLLSENKLSTLDHLKAQELAYYL